MKYDIKVLIDFLGQEIIHGSVVEGLNQEEAINNCKELYAENYGTFPENIQIVSCDLVKK